MLDRIKALMAVRQLSPSQFADLTTLPRPVVSHIMSGRTKPSLEVAQKIMAAFPDVSLDWFLNGRGPMTIGELPMAETSAPGAPAPASPATPPPRVRTARAASVAQPESGSLAPVANQVLAASGALIGSGVASLLAAPTPVAASAAGALPPPMPQPAVPEQSSVPAPSVVAMSPPASAGVQQVVRPERVVRRILVFYSDGTFSDHRPLPAEEAPFF